MKRHIMIKDLIGAQMEQDKWELSLIWKLIPKQEQNLSIIKKP